MGDLCQGVRHEVDVLKVHWNNPVTVIELTMKEPVVSGRIIGGARLRERSKETDA